ncbi:MAG TPA: sensor domain-containing diguanylate cyclase [Trinickia sp.]|jgi:diguanylate cyclase (GGDEF)-like protein|nr:sensor domain-containing diguanylate cyclase [Trinickia sp.]
MLIRGRTIIAISVALAATVVAICVLVLWQMRSDAARRAEDGALNLALLIERDTARNLELYDLSLQAVIEGMKLPGLERLRPEVRQLVLFDRSASAEDVGAMLVTDAAGNVLYDSSSLTPPRMNIVDRDYFTVHRDSPDAGLYVSRPFKPRMPDAGTSIALSRRLSHPDGSFAGIVVGTLRVDYFHKLFAGMNLGPHGSMALFFTDGTMLMRRPYDERIVGSALARFERFTGASSGVFSGYSAIDGVPRWYAYRRIGRFPIVVDVALSTDDMYAEWRSRAWTLGSLVGALDGVIIGLAVLLAGQLRRRLAVESELRALARTDGLTRLGNRRAFDELAAAEWRAAAEPQCSPLSVLLIDVDHFKGFNDLYGHAAGDDALLAVAHCIKDGVRRPSDHAVRYGGEEFVVLLPATEAAGALCVAERIRLSVEALGMRNEASEHGVLTVSIGVASTALCRFTHLRALTDGADAALYAAKAAGRNCIACYGAENVTSPAAKPPAARTDRDRAL